MVKTEKISMKEAEKALQEKGTRGNGWTATIEEIKKDGQPRRISELKRGQIAAGARAAKDAGLRYVTDYPTKTNPLGSLIILPAAPTPTAKGA